MAVESVTFFCVIRGVVLIYITIEGRMKYPLSLLNRFLC